MRTSKAVLIILAALLLVLAAGLVWLSNTHLMPPSQKMEQAIPDDRIPK